MNVVVVTLDVSALDHAAMDRCPRCHAQLDRHQPDMAHFDRVLATCPDCEAWYLSIPGAGLMVRLPDAESFLLASPHSQSDANGEFA